MDDHPETVAVWLTNRQVACWHFTEQNAALLRRELPAAQVVVCADEAQFLAVLPEASAALVWRFDPAWLERAPRLRRLATPAAGHDWLRVPPRPGLQITYGAFHGEIIAETVLGLMLGACRGLLHAQRLQDAGAVWPRNELAPGMRPLRGSHAVILGFGAIGQWIARLAKPFGVRITGVRRRSGMPRPEYFDAADRLVAPDKLDALLPAADHLILALPGDTGTDCILDARRLALLPPGACLYNVGRGNAVDETALAAALRENRLAFAGLDVFQQEPLPADSPLRLCPNALLLPHASAIAPNYLDLFVREFAASFLNG